MPALILPRRFYSQPHGRYEVDWSSPGLESVWVPLASGGSILYRPNQVLTYNTPSSAVAVSPAGVAYRSNANNELSLGSGVFGAVANVGARLVVTQIFGGENRYISGSGTPTASFRWRTNNADLAINVDGTDVCLATNAVSVGETCVLLAAANAGTESYLAKNGQILVVAAAGPTNSYGTNPQLHANGNWQGRGNFATSLHLAWSVYPGQDFAREITANPWQIFRADPVRIYFDVPAVGGDYSESLTGSQVTTSSGTLSPSISVAISGAEVTASSGTIVAATSDGVVGDEVTAESGFVATAVSIDISGSSVTTYSGALVSDISVALSGAEVTASAGTVSTAGDDLAALTGSEVTSSAGTVTASTSISIDGEQVTTATGTLIPAGSAAIIGDEVIVAGGDVTGNVTVALSGAEVAAYAGSVSPSGTDAAGLVGSEVTASAGALVSSISIALNGADVSAVAGAIGIAMAISGEQVNVDSGSLAAAIESAIGGDIVAANSGALTANTEVSITGSEVEAYSGTVSTSMEDAELLTGSEVTCSAGNMVGHVTIALTGSQVTVYAGSLQKPRGAIRGVVVTQKIEHAVVLGAVTGTTVTQLSRGTHVTS